jgi:hypothetical protein
MEFASSSARAVPRVLLHAGLLLTAVAVGLLGSVPTAGGLLLGLIGSAAFALLGSTALLGLILVSSGISLAFLTEGERTLLPGVGGATIDGIRLAVVLVAFVITLIARPSTLRLLSRVWIYIAFLLVATVSLLWSPDKLVGVRLFCRFAYPVVAFTLCALVVRERGPRSFNEFCFWAGVAATGFNLAVALLGLSPYEGAGYEARYHGASHPNPLGLFCSAVGLIMYVLWDRGFPRRYLILAAILAAQVVATGSRVSMITSALGLVTYELLRQRRRRAFTLLAAGALIWALMPTLGARTSNGYVGSEFLEGPGGGVINLSGRLILWGETWNVLIGDPRLFGNGLGSTEQFFAARFSGLSDVHNTYLSTLADLGIVGTACLIAFMVGVLVSSYLWRKREPSNLYVDLCICLAIMIPAASMSENIFYNYASLPTFLFAMIAMATYQRVSTEASCP